ncbi:17-beta-hydroxysteroid dehydrogenase type 3 [Clarias gariepinus]|uniref:17-beta-hydroxysteroid dehydrogenase type 3 isoform X2 n=1 Tax=Clarias gariepinus TaxID=13013 RepID=UPI00234D6F10|nr:17-beta-hydroxysteroid dehydrogenase type 3 isoform X2 [Clarias gariepinus]
MALIEFIFVLSGACIVLAWLGRVFTMLAPKVFWPIPGNFFTSMGKWAVITGGSDGIGKAYAEEFARLGLNVVIISRSKEKLDRVARELENKMDRKVMVIVADLTKNDIDGHIKKYIQGLEVAVLVNNVGILPSYLPYKFLDTVHLEEKINQMINCNVKAMVKMCQIVLPGMVKRGQGIILNISSGISKTPWPMYTLYSSTKVFVEIFSRGLQAEYKSNGILIQSVCPFGVSTAMIGFQKPSIITLTPEEFVRSSLRYLKAGEQTYGSVRHTVMGWIIQAIPAWALRKEAFHQSFQEYVKKQMGG